MGVESWAGIYDLKCLLKRSTKFVQLLNTLTLSKDLFACRLENTHLWRVNVVYPSGSAVTAGGGLCWNKKPLATSCSAGCNVLQSRAGLKKMYEKVAVGLQRQIKLLFRKGAAIFCPAPPTASLSFIFTTSHITILYSLKVVIFFSALALQSSSCSSETCI